MKQTKRTYVLATQRSISPERMFVNWVIICFFGKTTLLLLWFPGLQIGSDTASDRYRFFLRVLHAFPAQ